MSDTLARDDTRLDRALFIDIRRLSIISWMNILSIWKPSRTKSDTNASLTRTIVRLSYYFEFHYFFAHGCLFIYRHEHKDTNTRLFPRVSLAMTRLIPNARFTEYVALSFRWTIDRTESRSSTTRRHVRTSSFSYELPRISGSVRQRRNNRARNETMCRFPVQFRPRVFRKWFFPVRDNFFRSFFSVSHSLSARPKEFGLNGEI